MSSDHTEQLTERADFHEFISHFGDVSVWSGDETGFHYVSPGFENIWGRSIDDRTEFMSVFLDGIHPGDYDRVLAVVEDRDDRLANGEEIVIEHRVVRPDGDVRWVEARIFPVHNAAGSLSEVVGATIDVTDRKRAELDLERQNDRLEQFAQIVSHDIRNPLTTAMGYLNLVSADCDHEDLERIDQALTRIEELITDVLTLARTGDLARADGRIDLAEVAETAWMMAGNEEGTLVSDGLGVVAGDESSVRQLFENVFRNAVEYGGSAVTVRVGTTADGTGFYVADDGPGVPAADRESIFDTGYSTAHGGTGLGMSIVAGIVDAHGWTIDLTESSDGGVRLEITGVETIS